MTDRVFLLGAGFSRAISQEMPLMPELFVAVRRHLEQIGRPLGHEVTSLGEDIEQVLSFLAADQPWLDEAANLRNKAAFIDVSRAIHSVLQERQSVAVQAAPPTWLSQLVEYWHRMRSTVITFNYDVLVEALAIPLLGPYEGSPAPLYAVPVVPAAHRVAAVLGSTYPETFSLLKLHGSLTWYWSGYHAAPDDVIYDVGLTGGWSLEGIASPCKPEPARFVGDKFPMVVPPAATKSLFYENALLRTQWRAAADALGRADELVVIGYSLPESDLVVRTLLSASFRAGMVLPVDISIRPAERLTELFQDRVIETYCDRPDAVHALAKFICG